VEVRRKEGGGIERAGEQRESEQREQHELEQRELEQRELEMAWQSFNINSPGLSMTSSIEPTRFIEAIRSNEPAKSIETAVGAMAAALAPEIVQRTNATRALGSAHSSVNPQSNVTLPGSGGNAEDLGRKAARRRSILAVIAGRFCDPEFDLTEAARGLGLSRRYIQRLLEGAGKSFTEHVLECRLERVRAMLMDSRYQHMAIIDIALASGFSDVSHFNRMFRRRFGETPSSVRAAAVGAPKSRCAAG